MYTKSKEILVLISECSGLHKERLFKNNGEWKKTQPSNHQKMIQFLLSNRDNFLFNSDFSLSLQIVGFLFFSVR